MNSSSIGLVVLEENTCMFETVDGRTPDTAVIGLLYAHPMSLRLKKITGLLFHAWL